MHNPKNNLHFHIAASFIISLLCFESKAQFRILTPPTAPITVEDMDADNNGNLLFATDKGVLLLDTTGQWVEYNAQSGITNLHIKSVKHTPNGFVYSDAAKRLGTCDYFTATDSVFASSATYDYLSTLYVSNTGDTVLAGSDNGKLFRCNGSGVTELNLNGTYGSMTGIVVGKAGHFFSFNSNNKGLLYQIPNNPFLVLSTVSSGIPDNVIFSSLSKNDIVYYGTRKGLFTADYSNAPSVTYTTSNRQNTPGMPSDTISAIALSGSSLFIGTPRGLAMRINNAWSVYDTSNSNLPSNQVVKLAVNSKNELFLATKQGILCKFDTTFRDYAGIKTQLRSDDITLFFNPDKALLSINSSAELHGSLSVYTMDGKCIMSAELSSSSEEIKLANFQNGIYFYTIKDSRGELLKEGRLLYLR